MVIENLATVPGLAKIDHSRVTFIEGSVTDLLMGAFPGAAGISGGNPVRAPADITVEKSPDWVQGIPEGDWPDYYQKARIRL